MKHSSNKTQKNRPDGTLSITVTNHPPSSIEADSRTPVTQLASLGPDTALPAICFEIARLLNKIRFHIIQAWANPCSLDTDDDVYILSTHRSMVQELAPDLARGARYLRSDAAARDLLEADIRKRVESLLDAIGTEDHAEDFHLLCTVHEDPSVSPPARVLDGWTEETAVQEVCEWFWEPVLERIREIRETLEKGLDDRCRLAWGLGERLDQKIHPKCFYHGLLIIKESIRYGKIRSICSVVDRKPGELPADADWAGDLEQRMHELKIGSGWTADSLIALAKTTGEDALSEIGQLADVLRQELGNGNGKSKTEPRLGLDVNAINAEAKGERPEKSRGRNHERDEFIYNLACAGVQYKQIIKELKTHKQEWYIIDSIQGIRSAAIRFAERNNLNPPPPRQDK